MSFNKLMDTSPGALKKRYKGVAIPVQESTVRSMVSKRTSSVLKQAAQLRHLGAHKYDRKELEHLLGRSLSYEERRALAIAGDSRTLEDGMKRQASNRQRAMRDTLRVSHSSNSKGRATARTTKPVSDSSHTPTIGKWSKDGNWVTRGHTLRARYTDEPNFAGNENEQRLARMLTSKKKSRTGNTTSDETFAYAREASRLAHKQWQEMPKLIVESD